MSSPLIDSPFIYGSIPSGGTFAINVITARAPSNTIDTQYPAGTLWLSSLDMYTLNSQNQRVYGSGSLYYQAGNSSGSPNWTIISDGSSIVSVLGTANQITATNVAGTVTLSIPSTFIAPGSIASTTTITAGTGLTVTSGGAAITGTTTINTSGAAVTTIGTGGTGAVNIGNATGNTAVTGTLTTSAGITATTGNIVSSAGNINATVGSMSAGTTVTAGTGITSTTGNIVATAGQVNAGTSMTAGTTLTATLGNITATNGNIVRGTAGNKDIYSSVASTITAGANSAGTVVLTGGTATVSTTAVTASSIIRLYRQGIGATGAAALGIVTLGTVSAGVSFIINSVQAADATALQASDVSVIAWEIVN